MIEWTPVTPSDTFEIEIMSKAYEHQQYLKGLIFRYIGKNVDIVSLDITKGISTTAFPELINVIEKNLDTLFGTWQPSARKPSVEWLGELLDQRLLDYTDINRWFEMIQLLEQLILAISQRIPITGTFKTGTNRTRQVVKRIQIWNYKLNGEWMLGKDPFAVFR